MMPGCSEDPIVKFYVFGGLFHKTGTLFKVKGAIHRPAEVFVAELTDILKARGITVAEEKNRRTTPYGMVDPDFS